MTYLNTAAEGIPPPVVGEAYARYFEHRQRGSAGREQHMEEWARARGLAARFLGLVPDEIGLCSCSSEAFNLLYRALRLQPGDEVVVNDLDFPAGQTPWLQVDCPAAVRVWRAREGALRAEDLEPLLSDRTRLVSASLVSYYNGSLLPLEATAALVRSRPRARLALDVTQALGRIPLRLEGADFIVSSTHKWIMATHGGGIVGVPRARAEELAPPVGGWFNLEAPFDRDAGDPVRSKPGAAGYMVGMPPFPAVYAISAALEYVDRAGVSRIHEGCLPLVRRCLEGLRSLPVEVITPGEAEGLAGILAFRHPRMAELQERLLARKVHVMQSAGRMRVSIHGYNTLEDVERFLAVLEEAV
jgi:cysteine desulfurase / selenocysteine lyase